MPLGVRLAFGSFAVALAVAFIGTDAWLDSPAVFWTGVLLPIPGCLYIALMIRRDGRVNR